MRLIFCFVFCSHFSPEILQSFSVLAGTGCGNGGAVCDGHQLCRSPKTSDGEDAAQGTYMCAVCVNFVIVLGTVTVLHPKFCLVFGMRFTQDVVKIMIE